MFEYKTTFQQDNSPEFTYTIKIIYLLYVQHILATNSFQLC